MLAHRRQEMRCVVNPILRQMSQASGHCPEPCNFLRLLSEYGYSSIQTIWSRSRWSDVAFRTCSCHAIGLPSASPGPTRPGESSVSLNENCTFSLRVISRSSAVILLGWCLRVTLTCFKWFLHANVVPVLQTVLSSFKRLWKSLTLTRMDIWTLENSLLLWVTQDWSWTYKQHPSFKLYSRAVAQNHSSELLRLCRGGCKGSQGGSSSTP